MADHRPLLRLILSRLLRLLLSAIFARDNRSASALPWQRSCSSFERRLVAERGYALIKRAGSGWGRRQRLRLGRRRRCRRIIIGHLFVVLPLFASANQLRERRRERRWSWRMLVQLSLATAAGCGYGGWRRLAERRLRRLLSLLCLSPLPLRHSSQLICRVHACNGEVLTIAA